MFKCTKSICEKCGSSTEWEDFMFIILEALCDAVSVKLLFLSKEDALAFKAFANASMFGGGNGYGRYWVYADAEPYEISVIPKGAVARLDGSFIQSMQASIEGKNPDVEIECSMGSKMQQGVRFLTFKFEHNAPVETVAID